MTFLKTLTLVLAVSITCTLPCPPKEVPSFAAMFEEAKGTVVEYCGLAFEIGKSYASRAVDDRFRVMHVTTVNTPQLRWIRFQEDINSLKLSAEQVAALPYTTHDQEWFSDGAFSIDCDGTCYHPKQLNETPDRFSTALPIVDEIMLYSFMPLIVDEPMHQPGSEEALACWSEHLARLERKEKTLYRFRLG